MCISVAGFKQYVSDLPNMFDNLLLPLPVANGNRQSDFGRHGRALPPALRLDHAGDLR
eukprot:COSAG02_NODE_63816_length_262_cov_0.638037_1_plen_57_part_10